MASPPNQASRFKTAAREIEADESPAAFDALFSKIVPPKKAGDKALPKQTKKP